MTEPNPDQLNPNPHAVRDFNSAMAAIETHNDEFSMGKAMANLIFGLVELEDEEEGKEHIPFGEERSMAQDILELTNSPTLSAMGLKLTPVRREVVMFGPHGEEEIGPVRLQLEDGERLGRFLETVSKEEANDLFKENINNLIATLLSELSDSIVTNADGEFVVETLASGERIIAGLEHLGLGEVPVVHRLKTYIEHYKKGDLVEFVLGTRMQLFRAPEDQQFGPAKWQGDATPQFLQDRWDEVIALLRKAKANPKAADIYQQLMQGAKVSLAAARESWTELKGKYGENYGQGFEGVFNEVSARLQELEEATEQGS